MLGRGEDRAQPGPFIHPPDLESHKPATTKCSRFSEAWSPHTCRRDLLKREMHPLILSSHRQPLWNAGNVGYTTSQQRGEGWLFFSQSPAVIDFVFVWREIWWQVNSYSTASVIRTQFPRELSLFILKLLYAACSTQDDLFIVSHLLYPYHWIIWHIYQKH